MCYTNNMNEQQATMRGEETMGELADYMTTQQAAAYLGVSRSLLARRAKNESWLGAKRVGRQWFFLKARVLEYARSIAGKSKNDPTRGQP